MDRIRSLKVRITLWLKMRFARTYVMATYLGFPGRPQNPLSYLGILAFICFILLGLTGILLQVYYTPTPAGSFESVVKINNQIPYGFELRNIHYWLSNVMMILAITHLFYLYFARRYLANNEIIWITGILVGLLTIAEAYTGYALVVNARSVFATEIGIGILRNVQPALANLLQGASLADTVIRMYTLHIVMIPAVMGLLFFTHFPRRLTVDGPAVLVMIGSMLVIGGSLPAELGSSLSAAQGGGQITIPEWYLTGVYALLRTGAQVLLAAVILPFAFVLFFLLIPFADRRRPIGVERRAAVAAAGLTAVSHMVIITVWGFRAGDLLRPIESAMDLPINPTLFVGVLTLSAVLIFAVIFILSRKKQSKTPLTETPTKNERTLSGGVAALLISTILVFQILLFTHALFPQSSVTKGFPMIESGLSVLGFAAAAYAYAMSSQQQSLRA
jgi:quinol-cytochrome oxidoreductase complex cytochrome b subunit